MRILDKGERIDWRYGGDYEYITDKDIEELKQGKRAEIDVDGVRGERNLIPTAMRNPYWIMAVIVSHVQ